MGRLISLSFLPLVAMTASPTSGGAGSAGGAGGAGSGAGGGVTTKKLCLDLTSAVEGTSIEVVRLVVKEGSEEEYVIDLKKEEVFPQKYESANNLTVSNSEKPEETFEVKKMACGGIVTKSCGIIELPKTYGPGLDCTWTFNAAEPV